MKPEKVLGVLKLVRQESLIQVIENGIAMEKLALEAADATGNDWEYTQISNRLADARILLLILTGDIQMPPD